MAHMEPMDVDSISNDFDDKENSLQNSNVLPRTPSTEKGYEELDVSELNMKLRYSMTPASSPMSRSLIANCRDNKVCDNENNTINTIFNDNSNLTHSFNSTITDSTHKSTKFPLQAIPTEKFVDSNGNPIVRSLDVESSNITIKVNGTNNIDDNLSLPSTSSSLVHTPEATTPTKEITKDGDSPIMRGLKNVLNMFRSSQSPVPPDDITTCDLSSLESQKKEDASKLSTNLESIPTTINKNKENISKTNSPLKESLVFNEDLEKELMWKDEVTILFKEEKIPIHKLFLPLNSAALEKINSKPIEKGNMNTSVEYMDVLFNENNIADKTMTEIDKLSPHESDTINTESDSEFVDCETSYIKNDTRILEDNVNIDDISSEFTITNTNTIQPNDIVNEENTLPIMVGTDLPNETHPLSNIHNVTKKIEIENNCKQTINNDLPIMRKSLDEKNILLNSLKENVLNDTADQSNNSVYENISDIHCSNETFNLDKYSESTDKEYKENDIVKTSDILGNDVSLCEGDEDIKRYPSQKTDEIDNNSEELICDLDTTIVFKEPTLKNQTDILKANNITLPVKSQVFNEVEINLGVDDQTIDKKEIPLDKCEEKPNIENNFTNKLDSKLIENTISKQEHIQEQIIRIENKEINNPYNNLPSDIPLPYDSDIDKDIMIQDNNEQNVREAKSLNISHNNLNFNVPYSSESIQQTIARITFTETHAETIIHPINNLIANTSTIQTSQVASEDMTHIKDDVTANERDSFRIEINHSEKIMPKATDSTNEFPSKINDNIILPLNTYSLSTFDMNSPTQHTQDIQNVSLQNRDECIQIREPTIADDKNEIGEYKNEIYVKLQNDNDVSISSTNNKTLVHEMELDVSKQDSKNSENPFETTNKLTASLELKYCDSDTAGVMLQSSVEHMPSVEDDKNYIRNKTDILVKHDDVDIPTVNINTSVIEMDVDVSEHDSESSADVTESKNIFPTSSETAGCDNIIDNNIDVIKTESTESGPTILKDKNEIMKIDVNINETVSLSSVINNSVETEMELYLPKCDLEDSGNQIELKKSEPEEVFTENNIKNVDAKKYLDKISLDDNQLRNENDLKIDEVISNLTNSEISVTEMDLDVSKDYLIASENQIESLCPEGDIEDIKVEKNDFESINKLTDEKEEIVIENGVVIRDELFIPITKDEQNIENTSETKEFTSSSPPISSKFTHNGYNINFDEIDDPFTTKTNIRMSPTANVIKNDIPSTKNRKTKTEIQKRPQLNRRKTLHDHKKTNAIKERANASFDCVLKANNVVKNFEDNLGRIQEKHVINNQKHDQIEKKLDSASSTSNKLQDDIEINIPINSTFLGLPKSITEDESLNKVNSTSSEIYKSKNVFNLPEIDDINFNPFSTKLKIHQSPTKETEHYSFDKSMVNSNQSTSSDVCHVPLEQTIIKTGGIHAEQDNLQLLEPNLSTNISNATCSSKNGDDTTSGREVRTEDEDTVEGPFLEAEDFADIVKVADFENEKDIMNFEDLPTQTNYENENGEFFIDAEAFEFLLNQNKSNVVADSGKESLFLKFDPLFAKRVSSDGVLAALSKIQKRQSTPKKPTPLKMMLEEKSPTPGPSGTTPVGTAAPVASDVFEEPVAAMGKPMMVVNPAVASIVSPRKSTTPPRVNRRSLTFTSPAMAVIDRLLSLSGNSSGLNQDNYLPPSREYGETDFALTQLRELLAEKEIQVHNLRSESKELKERLATLESQVRTLETESEERLSKVKELNEHLTEKNKINKSMAVVVEEYERTIASLIAEMEQEKKHNAEERTRLISERDEQTAHLASMEVSFSDLHSKYEKSKQIILSMKSNEDTYKKSLNEFEVNLLKMQTNYDLLKQHATSKLNHANQELEKYNRAHDAEVLKLNAMIKRKELHITSLEESLSQKTKANEELTAICDELINKVG